MIHLNADEPVSGYELIRMGRLGCHVKKTVVLCCVDEATNKVHAVSLQWTKMN